MPRVTKATLEEDVKELRRRVRSLWLENKDLISKTKFLEKHAQVQYLNSYVISHEKEVDALAHTITALTSLLKKERY